MQIDGKALSNTILNALAVDVENLKKDGVTPTLAVILVGDNPASLAYIKQKQKAAERVGIHLIFHHKPNTITARDLQTLIEALNADLSIHGVIVQRPVPDQLGDVSAVLDSIDPTKDVDGFLPNSPYDVPVAVAVGLILRFVISAQAEISTGIKKQKPILDQTENDIATLKDKNLCIIGRGSTAGAPIFSYFTRRGFSPVVVHSQTKNPDEIIKNADIVISCVGKENVVTDQNLKPGAILISVGIWRDDVGKLHGDYEQSNIENITSFYTPTPGGVGPVNVAALMQNVVKACRMIRER